MQDRRRHRSGTPDEAARLYLQAALDRHGLVGLTLANEDGLLIAAASRGPLDVAWIAAVGERLYVTAVGGPLPPRAEVAAAVERILGHSLPAAA
jgi:hypothetical protein